MKKTSMANSTTTRDTGDLRKEYRFDYAQARPNRFAGRSKSKPVVVLLSEDVAQVFKDGESVNAALRAIIGAVPKRRAR